MAAPSRARANLAEEAENSAATPRSPGHNNILNGSVSLNRSEFPVRSTPIHNVELHKNGASFQKYSIAESLSNLETQRDQLVAEIYEIIQDRNLNDIEDPELLQFYFNKTAELEELEDQIQVHKIDALSIQLREKESHRHYGQKSVSEVNFAEESFKIDKKEPCQLFGQQPIFKVNFPEKKKIPKTFREELQQLYNQEPVFKANISEKNCKTETKSSQVLWEGLSEKGPKLGNIESHQLFGKEPLAFKTDFSEKSFKMDKPTSHQSFGQVSSFKVDLQEKGPKLEKESHQLFTQKSVSKTNTLENSSKMENKSCQLSNQVLISENKTSKVENTDYQHDLQQLSRLCISQLEEFRDQIQNVGTIHQSPSKVLTSKKTSDVDVKNGDDFGIQNQSNVPLVSATAKAESSTSLPIVYPWQLVTPTPNRSVPLDDRLVAKHSLLIDEALLELYNTVEDVDFNPNDSRCAGILKAKQAQLEELQNQLRVYETVMARASHDEQRKRESYRFSGRLPAFGKRSEIDDYIDQFDEENRFLIVQGQTGSGKSTQLPQYLADHPRMSGLKIICTQPRKIAAVSLADRVSVEYACGNRQAKAGFPVGYSIGGFRSKSVRGKTRIEFMTESRMLERLMNRLEEEFIDIGAIIIDEAHERSITCDILLGMLKKSDPLWKDILIVVSSATIDLVAFHKFFDNRAKIIEIEGRMYPVQRIYRPPIGGGTSKLGENGDIIEAVIEVELEIHISSGTSGGDILCFLPGADEIRRGAIWLEEKLNVAANNTELLSPVVYQLSGAQEAEEQRRVFEELDSSKFRKIILASPIAETSITINGVVYVVDSGVKKEMTFDPKRNISSLKTVSISQSSSLQREGRAGRTQPGVCYKLYSEEDFQTMNINTLPEIFRRPLPLAILYLRKMGINPLDFDWVSAPDVEAIQSAEEELIILGAIEKFSKQLTELGELISQSQQEPKMVRMIYTGIREGAGMIAIKIAALLSVSKSFFNYAGRDADAETKTKFDEKRKPFQHKDGDILTIFKLYTQYESLTGDDDKLNGKEKKKIRAEWLKKNSLNGKAFGTAEKTVEDLEYVFSRTRLWNGAQDLMPDDNGILRLFCSGYFLHAACRVNIKGRGRNRLNYFALEPEVSGFLPVKASFVQTTNGISDGTIPNWILFDQILKYPDSGTTFFPSSSRIELDWIQKESEIFYKRCLDKQELLPTEVVELKVSDTVLRAIFGKRLVNLPRLEEDLSCSLDADLFAGSLRAFFSKFFRPTVELKLKEEINRAMGVIEKETLEQTWLLNTRLVIGPGYEVTSVLFSGEYNTFYLRNLDRNCSREGFEQFIYSKISSDKVSSLQFVPQERSNTGVVKLLKSCDAVSLLNKLKDELNAIQNDVIVAPHLGDGSSGTIPRAEQLKLKISWPVGFSTGNATITVETYQEGNRIVDLLPLHFSGATATAIGKLTPEPTSKDPEVYRVERGKMKFLESATYQVQPVLKVRVKGLSLSVDEFEITDYLKKKLSITPLRVFMNRNAVKECQWNMFPKEREKNLEPFRDSCIGKDKDVTITDIFDKFGGRAGVLIHYSDTVALENAFSQLQKAYSEISSSYGQPFRVE